VGRAIVRNPKVFLFDEPLSNLDAKLRVTMRAELTKLHHDLQATIIYVTHDQVEAMTMANKIVVMNVAKVQQIGAPLELYNHPNNKFVAGFIGSPPMNFLTVKVKKESSGIVLDEGSFTFNAHPDHVEALSKYDGKDVFFGIRPEDLLYKAEAESNTMPVSIVVIEPLGAEIHLSVETANHQPLVVRTEPDHAFSIGQKVNFLPTLEKARYFDKETENAIVK
jgi:multiple sugar transport system ATP-binding protein